MIIYKPYTYLIQSRFNNQLYYNFMIIRKPAPCRQSSDTSSKGMGQMVHNYDRVVKRIGCMIIKGFG